MFLFLDTFEPVTRDAQAWWRHAGDWRGFLRS
jgi:hypothetical protein